MPVCVLFVFSRSGIVFNPSAGAITDYSQSAKGRDPYFKSQLYVRTPTTESRYSFYRIGWVSKRTQVMLFGHCCFPIGLSTLLMLPTDVTYWCYLQMLPTDVTYWCYLLMLPTDVTYWCYPLMLPIDVTYGCYLLMLPTIEIGWDCSLVINNK